MLYKYRFLILGVLFVGTLMIFWPGVYMHDSAIQYAQAVAGEYTDHHPPLMAFIWRYLNFIQAGSGLIFALQISMLYLGLIVLIRVADVLNFAKHQYWYLLLLLYPIYPQILIYEVVILKDVQCAAGFLLSGALLAYFTIKNYKPGWKACLILMLIFVYCAGVKYQARYLIITYAIWLGCLLVSRNIINKVFAGALIYILVLGTVVSIECVVTKPINRSNSWQYVKLYDLAAISVAAHHDLVPSFNKTPNFSMLHLEQQFSYPAVDSLVFKSNPLLQITRDPQQMQTLRADWWSAVRTYPKQYFKHRFKNLAHMLIARPGYEREAQDIPLSFHNDFKDVYWINTLVVNLIGTAFYIFMSHLPVVLLGVLYIALGLRCWQQRHSAKILVAFSGTGLLMVGIMIFMTMAGTPRYTYLSIIMIHAAHIFAFDCIKHSRNLRH